MRLSFLSITGVSHIIDQIPQRVKFSSRCQLENFYYCKPILCHLFPCGLQKDSDLWSTKVQIIERRTFSWPLWVYDFISFLQNAFLVWLLTLTLTSSVNSHDRICFFSIIWCYVFSHPIALHLWWVTFVIILSTSISGYQLCCQLLNWKVKIQR